MRESEEVLYLTHFCIYYKRSSKEVSNFPRKKERKKGFFAKSSMSFTTHAVVVLVVRERERRAKVKRFCISRTFVSNDV